MPPTGTDETEICFLQTDLSVVCERLGSTHYAPRDIISAALATIVVWGGCVPLLYASLLYRARASLERRHAPTQLSRSLGFLVDGYNPGYFWWELIELLRKLLLTGFLALLQPGSLLQLFCAIIVALVIFAIELYVRPYDSLVKTFLSLLSGFSIVLTLLGTLGFELVLRESSNSLLTSGLMLGVLFTAALLVAVAASCVLATRLIAAARQPIIRLVATRQPPVVTQPAGRFLGFVSHTWGTGQDQAHNITRQLQLLLPRVKLWLDVDYLDDIAKLEESVKASESVLIFLSAGYFHSANCRRELNAAVACGRPFVLVREADKSKGGASIAALETECRVNTSGLTSLPGEMHNSRSHLLSPLVLERIFGLEAQAKMITWVRVRTFQLVSLRQIAMGLLRHAPSYTRQAGLLERGLYVPSELSGARFLRPVTLLHSVANCGSTDVAKEMQQVAVALQPDLSFKLATSHSCPQAPEQQVTHCLLYLNNQTFISESEQSGPTAALVRWALQQGESVRMVLIHEQDAARGACEFRRFFEVTPSELGAARLYDTAHDSNSNRHPHPAC